MNYPISFESRNAALYLVFFDMRCRHSHILSEEVGYLVPSNLYLLVNFIRLGLNLTKSIRA
jgi:hypothetical protein